MPGGFAVAQQTSTRESNEGTSNASRFELARPVGAAPHEMDEARDAVREQFSDNAIVRGSGFGGKLVRESASKVE